MEAHKSYREYVGSGWIIALLSLVFFYLAGTMIFLQSKGQLHRPQLLLMSAVLAIIVLSLVVFRRLSVTVGEEGVRANYGPLGYEVPLTQVERVEKMKLSLFWGFGIRFARFEGRWFWVYNVVGAETVAIHTKGGGKRGLIVSTREPEALIAAIESRHSRA